MLNVVYAFGIMMYLAIAVIFYIEARKEFDMSKISKGEHVKIICFSLFWIFVFPYMSYIIKNERRNVKDKLD